MKKEGKKRKLGLKGLVVVILLVILLFAALIGFITDFLWFRELDYVSVFFTKLFTQLKIGIPTFIVVTFLAYVYLKFLKRGYFKKVKSNEETNHFHLNLITWGLAAVYGIITTYFAVSKLWFQFLQFSNSTDFDIRDPLFGLDNAFYIFRLSFIEEVNQIIILLLIAFAALTLIYYVILLSMRTPQMFEEAEPEPETESSGFSAGQGFDNVSDLFGRFAKNLGGQKKHRPKKQFDDKNFRILISIAEKQLTIVGVLFFLMVGVHFFLKQYNILFGSTGAVYGAGFTDINVTLWVYRIIMGLSVLAAIGFAVGISKRKVCLLYTSRQMT